MITRALAALKEVFIPKSEIREVETQTSILMKKSEHFKVKCAIDSEEVPCSELKTVPYTGIPAPAYLDIDPWFSPPVHSEKQMSYKEAHEQAVAEKQILDESETNESADIHQKLYEAATKSWTTVAESQGGSENFQEGPGGWNSGNGFSRVTG